ncbi:MAG: hypothetical protein WB992_18300 [Bryobacteraceae bacterium]
MRVEEALRLFELAEQAGCETDSCAAGRWTCHMLAGNFEQAWQESDAIAKRGRPDPNRFWDGRPLRGRSVLVRCLHGLGDTLQFIRYAPQIRREARRLAVEAQPTLKSLLEQADLADEVITWGDAEPYWDQQIEIIELPRIFRTTVSSIPNHVPYIDVPSVYPSCPCDESRPLRVGIVWASSVYNPGRSILLKDMSPWFAIPGVSFFSLQAGPEQAQLEPWSSRIESLYDKSNLILPMAGALKNLDLIITVDTMMAHLAGAMGRPVWTLLPYDCDWRWMLDREDSPWYPTMRLFRQPRPGDWKSVIERVTQALECAKPQLK